jgi:acyl-CoA thioester hydrolase
MPEFKFYHPVEVRYNDLDPQGHVNNAAYMVYLEQARARYMQHLGLWDGESFLDLGIILAEAKITYRAPVFFGQPVRVGVSVTYIGNKSMEMHYSLQDTANGKELAHGSTVLVTYDYRQDKSIPVPTAWRETILRFEGLSLKTPG